MGYNAEKLYGAWCCYNVEKLHGAWWFYVHCEKSWHMFDREWDAHKCPAVAR